MLRALSGLRPLGMHVRTLTASTVAASGNKGVPDPVSLPDLPYAYDALEPHISKEIMEIHHSKHHNAYVTNLNLTLEKVSAAVDAGDADAAKLFDSAINFNHGGHINHSIFWKNLCPPSEYTAPEGDLLEAIITKYGSLESLQSEFNAKAAAVQGSGWGWLGYNLRSREIVITTTPNQDALLKFQGLEPLLGVDVWEHAYYLQYKNVRPEYLKEVWHVVNWRDVAQRFRAARDAAQ